MQEKKDAFIVVGGGILQSYMVKEVLQRDMIPIVTDDNPNCYCAKIPGVIFAKIDTYNIRAHVKYVKSLLENKENSFKIRGASTCGADVGDTVAAVSKEISSF